MTLDTRIYVIDKTDPRELFAKCQSLLTPYDEDRRTPDRQRSDEDCSGIHDETAQTIANSVGQGLPAWLMVHHRPDGMYRTAEQAAVHEYCNHPDAEYGYDEEEPTCHEAEHRPVCFAEVMFDTAYGYRGPDGIRCGDLHARLIAELGAWLDAKGVRWRWQNEFTGEVHEGYERLIELASSGFKATAWFQTTVMPAIAARMDDAS